ncbi:DMT family transporter [Actinocatenispora comari]|uniref:Multidrug transporter n=1 Tax=Actinocatenispora comari TaxID=2807577 RepID=A0A8J4EIB8_9ACTN|nr:DMT family transporter [Actinocatenispora comari]GIL25071.1 multidrug transporter [Actinocatenispora comari]
MAGVALALASAGCYGLSDVVGGLSARRAPFATVAALGQLTALVLTLTAAPLTTAQPPSFSDLGWGGLSGLGTGLGMLMLFRGLSRATMSVVVPVSAVGGVTLPVLVSVAFLGERPATLTWLGIALALPALWMVARQRTDQTGTTDTGMADGLAAGVGIAVQYLALAQASGQSGIWPVTAGRVSATAVLVLVVLRGPKTRRRLPSPRVMLGALTSGATAAIALVCYLLAAKQQLTTVAVVLSSLYPAVPVLFGLTVLRERLRWQQAVGLVAAGCAVALITVAS